MSLVDSQGKASRYNEQRKTASATAEAIVEASKIVQETATLRYEPERPTVQQLEQREEEQVAQVQATASGDSTPTDVDRLSGEGQNLAEAANVTSSVPNLEGPVVATGLAEKASVAESEDVFHASTSLRATGGKSSLRTSQAQEDMATTISKDMSKDTPKKIKVTKGLRKMKVHELKSMLSQHGLETSGRKSELLDRLDAFLK